MLTGIAPVVFERAEGATVFAEDGRQYLDCFAGVAVISAGHSNPEVISAAKAQLEKYIHCCSYAYYSKPMADLAEKLSQITPGKLNKSFFSNSGAEAVEGALKLARLYTGKREFIALQASFHGRSHATLSVTGNSTRKKRAGPYMPGVSFAPAPYCYRCAFKLKPRDCDLRCAGYIEDIIKLNTYNDVAAFIAEPVLGEGGIIPPPEGYFKRVKEILDQHQILLIADEVQSGFARTGKMFAIEHYGVEPDIMAMAKGIANGFPLSAFIAPDKIADSFQPYEHYSTFGGNPVSCVAALATINFLEREKIAPKALAKEKLFKKKLGAIQSKHPLIGDVRGRGLTLGIELVKDEAKTPAAEETSLVQKRCLQNGLLIGTGGIYSNVLRIQPPLVISEEEIDKATGIIEKALVSL